MEKFDCKNHRRHRTRLENYDYSKEGLYFITICTQHRKRLFGEIINQEMILNRAGIMIERWIYETEKKFPNVHWLDLVIMPNHLHCIWEIKTIVGADLCVGPNQQTQTGRHAGRPLQNVIQWFKTMTTNEYIRNVKNNGWKPFEDKLWQRNYYDHIIRNEESYNRIYEYIENNPLNWNSGDVE